LRRLPQGADALFFVGQGPPPAEERLIQLAVQDDYLSLPRKVQALCRFALEHYEFDYLFKCDDDTYVSIERLFDLLKERAQYIGGAEWVREGYASGGAGYLLSRRAVELVAGAPVPADGAEDVWVGRVLSAAGVKLRPTARLLMDHRDHPRRENNIVSAHWCSPELMKAIHAGLRE
jgi:hypothetical protein